MFLGVHVSGSSKTTVSLSNVIAELQEFRVLGDILSEMANSLSLFLRTLVVTANVCVRKYTMKNGVSMEIILRKDVKGELLNSEHTGVFACVCVPIHALALQEVPYCDTFCNYCLFIILYTISKQHVQHNKQQE